MKRKAASPRQEDTDPEIIVRRRTLLARLFPKVEDWAEKKKQMKSVLDIADSFEMTASQWEKRGHWEKGGFFMMSAARIMTAALDIKYSREHYARQQSLLRKAVIDYAVEIDLRYDPAMHYSMHKAALMMNEAELAKKHYSLLVRGLERMVMEPDLDESVRLNRLKRDFLSELWEGGQISTSEIARKAIFFCKLAERRGRKGAENELREWMEKEWSAKYGDPHVLLVQLYGESVVSRP